MISCSYSLLDWGLTHCSNPNYPSFVFGAFQFPKPRAIIPIHDILIVECNKGRGWAFLSSCHLYSPKGKTLVSGGETPLIKLSRTRFSKTQCCRFESYVSHVSQRYARNVEYCIEKHLECSRYSTVISKLNTTSVEKGSS